MQADSAHVHGVTPTFHDWLADDAPGPEPAVIPPGIAELGETLATRRFGDLPQRHHVVEKAYAIGRHTIAADDYSRFTEASGRPSPIWSG